MKICRKGLHQYNSSPRGCPECGKAYTALWRKANKSHINEYNTKRYQEDSENIKSRAKLWHKNNPEKSKINSRTYHRVNAGRLKAVYANYKKKNPEKSRASTSSYKKSNPDKVNALSAKRRALKIQRTPLWLTEEHYKEIQSFYLIASTNNLHVDHIVPLQGKNVSGLHVPWNLQILTASDNLSKGNKFT